MMRNDNVHTSVGPGGRTRLFPPRIGIFQAELLELYGNIKILLLIEKRL